MNIAIDDFSSAFAFSGGGDVETHRTELIKQSTAIKRFGEAGLREHPQRDSVAVAMTLLRPEQLAAILQNTTNALQGNAAQPRTPQDANIPQLASEPFALSPLSQIASGADNPATSLTASARMTSLLGKINQLTGDVTLQKMVDQLKIYNAQLAGHSQTYGVLADQLEQHAQQWANDSDALTQAQTLVNGLKQQATAATDTYTDAQKQLQFLQNQAERELQENGVLSPDLSKKIEEAKCAVTEAYNHKQRAVAHYEDALKNRLEPARLAEIASRAILENTRQQAQALLGSMPNQQISVIESKRKQQNENAKSLSYLLAIVAELINKSASEDLQAGAALKQKLAEAAVKDAEKKAREYDIEQRKAEEMQKTMGCIGKILGWAIAIVGFAAAIFTGGTSLALAAVGLALTAGDAIYQAVTGESFIQQAMQPIMEHIIKPLIDLLAKYYSFILEQLGVDKETAAIISETLGAIAAVVLLIAVAMVAGSLMGKLVDKLSSTAIIQSTREAMKKMLQTMMDNTIGRTIMAWGSTATRSFIVQSIKSARWVNRVQQSQNVAMTVNVAMQTGMEIVVAGNKVEAEKVRAKMLEDLALQNILNALMDRMVDSFTQRIAAANAIIENMATVAENQMQAGKFITRKMQHVAG
ncbi:MULTISPECIES: type III secretion system translocon subunit SctE [unclassified Symbiopectobacterium]|uniref:type III secretion system translocon subunit SctE n=1 Tax=unclassified Symbiopectobacterium TaxID=2794573 RepID=UPI00222676F5|nr:MULTISPECIES: type III secretion system translocon subunit SctE [unclassified Symbiopectobacterium]MCW2474853.1 type III secretion system translocon subunit SctE [Candidatus Symbiopectobacterium sp. NZEC151]MCW2482285.1 type III secretion system translocon subunit SctE [Candidatus Symbiopectobacterium sp. NZEC135]